MSKGKNKQSTTMEDHGSLRYRDGEVEEDFFDNSDYEIALILLELSHPVEVSSDSPFLHQWGHTKKRSTSVFLNPPDPVIKSLPSTEVGEMGSTSSSSCLTGEAKKTNPQSIKKGFEEEFSTTNQRLKQKISSQLNASRWVLEAEMGLIRAQVGLVAHVIPKKRRIDGLNLRNLQPLRDVETASFVRYARGNLEQRGFDLNLPAAEEGNRIAAMIDFQRMVAKAQAAAQARKRRLGIIRSKRIISP